MASSSLPGLSFYLAISLPLSFDGNAARSCIGIKIDDNPHETSSQCWCEPPDRCELEFELQSEAAEMDFYYSLAGRYCSLARPPAWHSELSRVASTGPPTRRHRHTLMAAPTCCWIAATAAPLVNPLDLGCNDADDDGLQARRGSSRVRNGEWRWGREGCVRRGRGAEAEGAPPTEAVRPLGWAGLAGSGHRSGTGVGWRHGVRAHTGRTRSGRRARPSLRCGPSAGCPHLTSALRACLELKRAVARLWSGDGTREINTYERTDGREGT